MKGHKVKQLIRLHDRTGIPIKDIEQKFLEDKLFAAICVSKDLNLKRGNTYLREFTKYLTNQTFISNLITHWRTPRLYITDGKITKKRLNVKSSSIHLSCKIKGKRSYFVRFHSDGSGGSQSSRMQNIVRLFENSESNESGQFYAICSGSFYTDERLLDINKYHNSNNCFALSENQFKTYLRSLDGGDKI
ncbi:hypothetical protein [Candidatus Lokiarchaeum ossiferum]